MDGLYFASELLLASLGFSTDREEVREALRGVVGRQGGAGRGRAIATALVEELWSVEGAREVREK